MRAVQCRELVGLEGLHAAELPMPQPGACCVRIRVRAAGVNFADGLMIAGRYQERPGLPFVPGLEVAGEIDALGAAVHGLEVGQRVLAVLGHGGFAEYAIALVDDVVPIPDEMDFATAAGFGIAYGTAHGGLVWRAGLHGGETLLVHGAAGGVGLMTVECGKAMGARVIATARGPEHLEVARAHGADEVVDSTDPALVERLRAVIGEQGADVIVDPVGGPLLAASLKVVAWEGRIVIVGFASGEVPAIPANILLVKNAAVLGFYWGSYRRHDPARLRRGIEELLDWWSNGLLRPHLSHRLPLERAAEALALLRDRRSSGKIVLTMG